MPLLAISTPLILFISAAGVIQAILLGALLYFHPKSDKSVTSYLSLHILMTAVFMVMPLTQYFFSWHTIVFLFPFQFLIGPFIYLYVRSFKETFTWQKVWPHLLFFAFFLVTDTFAYFELIKKYPSPDKVPEEMLLSPSSYVRVIIRNVQMLLYYFLAKKELRSYQKSIQHLYSETSKINLSWVNWLLNGFLLLIITVFILFFLVFNYPGKFNLLMLINTSVITPYIYAVALRGIGQPTLWQIQADKNKKNIEEEIKEAEKLNSISKNEKENQVIVKGLTDIKIAEITSRIIVLLENEHLYQEPELTLQTLSDKIGAPSYLVSQAINEGLKKNFYDLVNSYRVEEAKRLLLDPKSNNYTVLSVGFDAGFNSKTTFNTVFKKFTGSTPTEFRESRKKTLSSRQSS